MNSNAFAGTRVTQSRTLRESVATTRVHFQRQTSGRERHSVAALDIIIDASLTTAMFAYPFTAGWIDSSGVRLTPGARADRIGTAVALLDSVAAAGLLETHAIVRDAAVAARRASFVTFATHARPDDVHDVILAASDTSPAARALALAVTPDFYGVTLKDITFDELPLSAEVAQLSEGARALIPFEQEEWYQEDLGRAWFLLTDKPWVSHVCVASRDAIGSNPASVAAAIDRLRTARDIARERGRELRRDLARIHGVDRELLTETLADQTLELGPEEAAGLKHLWRRAGLSVADKQFTSALVWMRRVTT